MPTLKNLKKEGKVKLKKPNQEISDLYLKKANECITAANILKTENLPEYSILMSYNSMIKSVYSLFFKIGITAKQEYAPLILTNVLFRKDLAKILRTAKNQINKQTQLIPITTITNNNAEKTIKQAAELLFSIEMMLKQIDEDEISRIQRKFKLI